MKKKKSKTIKEAFGEDVTGIIVTKEPNKNALYTVRENEHFKVTKKEIEIETNPLSDICKDLDIGYWGEEDEN